MAHRSNYVPWWAAPFAVAWFAALFLPDLVKAQHPRIALTMFVASRACFLLLVAAMACCCWWMFYNLRIERRDRFLAALWPQIACFALACFLTLGVISGAVQLIREAVQRAI